VEQRVLENRERKYELSFCKYHTSELWKQEK